LIDLLRDPIWQFIGAIVAIVALVITILIYLRQRARRAIAFKVVTKTPLISVHDTTQGKVEVLFNGKPVSNVMLLIFELFNDGNLPILPTDFVSPVTFSFGETTKILDVQILETRPKGIAPSIGVQSNVLELKPLLLNMHDLIRLKVLLSGFENEISVEGRIIGVDEIACRESETTRFPLGLAVFLVIGLTVLTYAISILVFRDLVQAQRMAMIMALIFGAFTILWMYTQAETIRRA
jgi:hypothetical protein